MIKIKTQVLLFLFLSLSIKAIDAQQIDRKLLIWENKIIDIGTVLEEDGSVEVQFIGINQSDSSIVIADISTDCGCAIAAYSSDTIYQSNVASFTVNFNPDYKGGAFRKMIVVRTNLDLYGDTLYLQGFNIPFPQDTEYAYPYKSQDIGLRLSTINMGDVYTHEPRKKMIELYNFGEESLSLTSVEDHMPEYLKIDLKPSSIASNQRGLLIIDYDGNIKNDLGLVDEELLINFSGKSNPVSVRLVANIFEYFEPVPKSRAGIVPRLGINEIDLDLGNISTDQIVKKDVKLTNNGQEILEIRKVITNCNCLEVQFDKESLAAAETMQLHFSFDPRERRGIDHKHITLFTNDPIQPVRTIVIRSMIK